MIEYIILVRMISLTIAIWFTMLNVMRGFRGQSVSEYNMLIMSSSITIFIYAMGWLN